MPEPVTSPDLHLALVRAERLVGRIQAELPGLQVGCIHHESLPVIVSVEIELWDERSFAGGEVHEDVTVAILAVFAEGTSVVDGNEPPQEGDKDDVLVDDDQVITKVQLQARLDLDTTTEAICEARQRLEAVRRQRWAGKFGDDVGTSDREFFVYDPIDESWSHHHWEAEARSELEQVVKRLNTEASDGWREDATRARLVEGRVIAQLELVQTANADDEREDEDDAPCWSNGWDYMAVGYVADVATPAGNSADFPAQSAETPATDWGEVYRSLTGLVSMARDEAGWGCLRSGDRLTDEQAIERLIAGWRRTHSELDRTQLASCDAHDALTELGVSREGTLAERIGRLAGGDELVTVNLLGQTTWKGVRVSPSRLIQGGLRAVGENGLWRGDVGHAGVHSIVPFNTDRPDYWAPRWQLDEAREELASVQRDHAIDVSDNNSAHAALLDVVGGIVDGQLGTLPNLARLAAAEIRRLRGELGTDVASLAELAASLIPQWHRAVALDDRQEDEAGALGRLVDSDDDGSVVPL